MIKPKDLGFYGQFHVAILENGDLKISLSDSDRLDLKEWVDENEYYYPDFEEVLEPLYTNGFEWVAPEHLGLTSCPFSLAFIDGDISYPDKVNWAKSDIWAFVEYEVYHPLEKLANQGYVVFKYLENDKTEDKTTMKPYKIVIDYVSENEITFAVTRNGILWVFGYRPQRSIHTISNASVERMRRFFNISKGYSSDTKGWMLTANKD